MRRVFIPLIFSFMIQCSFGQACGIYRIKYIGNIKSESLQVENVKLPTIEYLHGLEEENSEKAFVEIKPIDNEIDIELVSGLTSHLYDLEGLLKFYKAKRNSIPVMILVTQNGQNKEIRIDLTWNNIQIKGQKDEKFGNLFELNLNEIRIK